MAVSLKLGSIPNPAQGKDELAFFLQPEKALAHVEKHLLTDPERKAWAALAPEAVPPTGKDAVRLRKKLRKSAEAAQRLYEAYRQEAARAAREARALGWVASKETGPGSRVLVSLGLSGVVLVATERRTGSAREAYVLTAFAAGAGRAEEAVGPRSLRRRQRQAREYPVRYGDASSAYFHRFFKKAVRFVRRTVFVASPRVEDTRLRDYSLLAGCLKGRPEVREAGWKEACRRFGREFALDNR